MKGGETTRCVQKHLVDSNATQAAIRSGYSKKTAAEQASRLLRNVKVAKEIKQAKKTLTKKVSLNAERVARRAT